MDLNNLFERQLAEWPACREHYSQLADAEQRRLNVDGCEYLLTYNPARARSAKANVSNGRALTATGEVRPCFLCSDALPTEQIKEEVETLPSRHKYLVAVNPYPIVDHHFTIISKEHVRQDFQGRLWDMAFFADLFPDYLIFFNGACSGASAPDHMHFQAVPKSAVPMLSWGEEQRIRLGVTQQLPHIDESDNKNILTWTEGTFAYWLVIDRKAHRPSQYFLPDQDPQHVVLSPAALEFCGLVPLCREEDYRKMTPSLLSNMLQQCHRHEPMLHVGIMEGQQIRFSAEERLHAMNYLGENLMKDVMDYGSNRAEAHEMTEYWCHMEPFTLEGVTIGKQFHWQKQEDQVFRGSLHIIAREGTLHAINLIPVEEYLKSVISSEMSATNSLELLKAHAIISRSWVLRQLEAHTAKTLNSADQATLSHDKQQTIRYWDHSDHTLYDVCADDHCQRYQGVNRQDSPLVMQAIEATRGVVLVDAEGNICDARFSKSCGGRTELFSTCWQDRDYDYLQSVEDPYCSPDFISQLPGGMSSVLSQVLNDYDQQTVNYHDWEVTYTRQQLSDIVEKKLGLELGDILHIDPVERGASGRIKTLRLVGSKAAHIIGKELLIRKSLSDSHLLSSWFDVEETSEGFHLKGHGWGHGVGLCQIGAAAMALKGFTAEEILSHYYPGACLKTMY